MVVILAAAAAITAAGVGAYHGGKLAVEDVGKKIRRRKTARARQAERSDEEAMKSRARQMDDSRKKNMSVSDRVERFKKGIPGGANRGGLTRKSQL